MANNKLGRRNCLPVIYVRGSHYDIGFDIGRTFSNLITNLVSTHPSLNKLYLPIYETAEGKEAYNATLNCVKERFPQYVRELQGTADGANVPFHKLFLIHMDDILPKAVENKSSGLSNGCSTVYCNQPRQEILGHSEDNLSEIMNNMYVVNAHITESNPHEVFSALCYAGHLPGFAMSYNHHGLVFTVNIISAKQLIPGKTPRSFLTRALLSAKNFVKAESILQDVGCGAGDAVSINMTFLKQEGDRMFHNVEVGPAVPPSKESVMSVLNISPGEHCHHCNKFLRLEVPEEGGMIMASSNARHEVSTRLSEPRNINHVIEFLGDQSHPQHTVFRENGPNDDMVKTLCVGIFDCVARTWSIYIENPKNSDPLVTLPIMLM